MCRTSPSIRSIQSRRRHYVPSRSFCLNPNVEPKCLDGKFDETTAVPSSSRIQADANSVFKFSSIGWYEASFPRVEEGVIRWLAVASSPIHSGLPC